MRVGDIACGVDVLSARLQVLVAGDAIVELEASRLGELHAGLNANADDDEVRLDPMIAGQADGRDLALALDRLD